jgi:hypothetical protein
MTAIAFLHLTGLSSSTASFVIDESDDCPAADIDADMGGSRALDDIDDGPFEPISWADFHDVILV